MKFEAEINETWFKQSGSDQARRQKIKSALDGIDLTTSNASSLTADLEAALGRDRFNSPGIDSRPPMAKPYGPDGVEVRDFYGLPETIATYLPRK